jgi:hypothetical protein
MNLLFSVVLWGQTTNNFERYLKVDRNEIAFKPEGDSLLVGEFRISARSGIKSFGLLRAIFQGQPITLDRDSVPVSQEIEVMMNLTKRPQGWRRNVFTPRYLNAFTFQAC